MRYMSLKEIGKRFDWFLVRVLLLLVLLMYVVAAFAEEKRMNPAQCEYVAQFIYWVPDYRDVKADKDLIEARVGVNVPAWARIQIIEEVERIWLTKETQNEAVENWMRKCTAVST